MWPMLAQSHARKPAPPLAARGMWLRLHGGADAFGSALGDAVVGSIARGDGNQGQQARKDATAPQEVSLTRAQEDRIRSGATVSDVDPYGDGDGPMAGSTRAVRKDGRDRLMMNGAGQLVSPDSIESLRQSDGTYRVEITGTSADIPLTADQSAALALGAGPRTAESAAQVVRADGFGRLLEGAFSGGGDGAPVESFTQRNDRKVIAGTYDRFSEIGSALSDGRWGDALGHVTYEASPEARNAAVNRLFPQPSQAMRDLEIMTGPSSGAIVFGIAKYGFGASSEAAEALSGVANAVEGIGGAITPFGRQRSANGLFPADPAEPPFNPDGSVGAAKPWSTKARINYAELPNEGKIRYVPPKGYEASMPLPRGQNNGYIDRFGNEWVKGPSRTEGQPFEWDVQLSRQGRNQLGWATRDGSHLNVSLDGKITHK